MNENMSLTKLVSVRVRVGVSMDFDSLVLANVLLVAEMVDVESMLMVRLCEMD